MVKKILKTCCLRIRKSTLEIINKKSSENNSLNNLFHVVFKTLLTIITIQKCLTANINKITSSYPSKLGHKKGNKI